MTTLSEMQVDKYVLEAREMRGQMIRETLTGFAALLTKTLPEGLRRYYQRRRTLAALEQLDPRVLSDIGLHPGSLRRAAFAAADHAFDQEKRGVERPSFLTSAQAMGSPITVEALAANSNDGSKDGTKDGSRKAA